MIYFGCILKITEFKCFANHKRGGIFLFRIIINPLAGAGKPMALRPRVEALLAERGISYETVLTDGGNHAVNLSKQAAADGARAVVIVGGDGSLNEAVNGLIGSSTILYIVPCGTGNDFARVFRLPKDPIEALRMQLDAPVGVIDAGAANEFRFLNVAGAGFDVEVLRQMEAYKEKYSGIWPYLLGVIRAVKAFRPFEATLEAQGQTFSGRFTLMVFANGQYYGGGMRVARKADPRDGLLDMIYIPALPKWLISLCLPLFLPGWYDVLPFVRRMRVSKATLLSKGVTLNMDGELRDVDRADFELLPGAIRMPVLPCRQG
ncbi:MAG: diacylglycerol kinase family lipid kinase [Eubacteriales bacterium]|nr:diacylglycerol kinase family lipid kinase [Eubacteriales bacterium]